MARKASSAEDREATESLSIFLAKEGVGEPSDLLKSTAGLRTFQISDGEGALGTLYIQTRRSRMPRWARFFEDQVEHGAFGKVSSAAAVFVVRIEERTVLVAFGQGRHLINMQSMEDRFGRRVTLNSIGEDRVRSLDKQTFDTIARHTRVQSNKEARPSELGIDVDQDLLRAITGSPEDEALGRTLSGVEALHAMVAVDLSGLRELLSEYVEQFGKDSYKSAFSWVDQTVEITDKAKQLELDSLMLEKVLAEDFDRCWLAIPEPIDWSLVAGFRYRRGTRQPIVHDIAFETFVESIPDGSDLDLDVLRRREVHCVGPDDIDLYSWPIYRCIYCELDLDESTYLLSSGKWYCVTKDFVAQVNDAIRRIPKYGRELPSFGDETEEGYNKRVAETDSGAFALMDRKLISYGGGYSKVEFCDLFTDTRELIHVKRYGGSGVLSHLFTQAAVSGQLFVSDHDFRKAVNALLPRSHKLSSSTPRPDTTEFTVVFGIVSSESGSSLTLPFFSRLALKNAAKLLQGFGYRIATAKIPVENIVARTKKYKPKT